MERLRRRCFFCVHADQEVLIGTLLDLLPSLSLFRSLTRSPVS